MTSPERGASGADRAVGSVAAGPTVSVLGIRNPSRYPQLTARQRLNAAERISNTYELLGRAMYSLGSTPEAQERSLRLLMRNLTKEQLRTFLGAKYIDVEGASGNIYRIWCTGSPISNIWWIRQGQHRGRLCVAPADPHNDLPIYDTYLGQLLLIHTDEKKFLKIAVPSGPHPTRGPVRQFFRNLFRA